MLQVVVKAESQEGDRHELTMGIRRMTPGPFSDYLFSVADQQVLYKNYPRWSETSTALASRAAAALNIDELLPDGESIDRLKVTIKLIPFGGEVPLAEFRYQGGRLEIRDTGTPPLMADVNIAAGSGLVSRCLRLAAWGHDGALPAFVPPTPPIHIYTSAGSDTRFVRVAEVPEPARSGLESVLRRYAWGQPAFPGEGNCIWLQDWERFLKG
jgi:hypothetical protein